MLTIQRAQYEVFCQHALEQYVQGTLVQFHNYFPGPCHVIGDAPLRDMIRLGVSRAANYKITRESNVSLYTSVMLLCGSFFDKDPQYPWARQVLEDNSLKTEGDRAERLYDAFVGYWERVAGDNRGSLIMAALRTRNRSVDTFNDLLPQEIKEYLRNAWPQKAAELGDRGIDEMLHEAELRAAEYQMISRRDHAVTSSLIFTLGNGFDKDPMYPWAAHVLNSPDIVPEHRGTRLYEAARRYAERWVGFAKREVR